MPMPQPTRYILWVRDSGAANAVPCLDNRDEFFEFCMISLDICKIIKVFTHHLGNKHNSWQIFDFVFANQFPIS